MIEQLISLNKVDIYFMEMGTEILILSWVFSFTRIKVFLKHKYELVWIKNYNKNITEIFIKSRYNSFFKIWSS